MDAADDRAPRTDDTAPTCMASRMGTLSRVVMLGFGVAPIAAAFVAFGVGIGGGYASLFEVEGLAWLGYPLLIPFFTFAAIMVYAMLVINNRRLDTTAKAMWLAGVVLAGPIGIPAYWWAHVWNAPRLGG